MDIQRKKERIIKLIEKADNSLIEKIEQFIANTTNTVSASDIQNKIKQDMIGSPMSIEEYNRDIEIAINEIEKGNSIAHKDVLNRIKKW